MKMSSNTNKKSLKPTKNDVPKHIAIILDGNRRFAKRLMLKPWRGHEWGAKKVEALIDWIKEIEDIKELTLYSFSMENFNRPKKEFDYLMDMFLKELMKYSEDKRFEEYGIKVRFIGRIHLFPEPIFELMKKIMERTKNNSKYIINFAMAYGGQQEIIDATKKIAKAIEQGELKAEDVNAEFFEKNLYMVDEPDLIIRTGGEKRTSNFLNYQSAYSEWFYIEKMWPEFEKEDLLECIEDFKKRKRRFGK